MRSALGKGETFFERPEWGRFADGDYMATGEARLVQISVASDSDKASSTSTPR
jgi:hypothetical protein